MTVGLSTTSIAPFSSQFLSDTAYESCVFPGTCGGFLPEGPDYAVVFSGTLSANLTGTGAFDLVIPLTTPFTYDPSVGNLLLNVVMSYQTHSANLVGFTSSLYYSDSAAVVDDDWVWFGPNHAPGQLISSQDTSSLLTQFTVSGLPPPTNLQAPRWATTELKSS